MRIPRDARAWGLPLALLYGAVVRLRNWAYDRGWRSSRPGALHTLVLGNVTVGGTGKTPHALYMVRALERIVGEGRVGVLSRGYGRRTRGFRWVSAEDAATATGDEPLLIKRHLGEVAVAVCEDRLAGLAAMRAQAPHLRWVVLDDALQHRRLRPDLALVLLDESQPVGLDFYLPCGRLRDTPRSLARADAALLTRLPTDASPAMLAASLERQGWPADRPHWGTTMHMRFPDLPQTPPRAIAVAGIAQPQRFLDALPGPFELMASFTYPDHHPYSERDVRHWVQAAHHHRASLLVTTEKDAMRIQPLSAVLHPLEMMTVGLEVQFFLAQTFQKWLEQKVTQIEEGAR
jgi:tetraacyldisaccharide 4'-kinase